MLLYKVGHVVVNAWLSVVYGWRAYGVENVPKEGPVILAANHLSYLDPPLIGVAMDRPVHFMAKAELFRIPIFSNFLRAIHTIPVRRGGADRAAIREAFAVLERGGVFALFPEGTRNRTGTLLEPQRGVSLIALRSNAVVIPVGITGTSRLDRKLHPVKRPLLEIRFGPPVDLDDLRTEPGGKHIMTEASHRIMKAIAEQIEISRRGRIKRADIE